MLRCMTFSTQDELYMRRSIELAKKGIGYTNPNPIVGAVIVKEGRIIGEGYHRKYGSLHAERDAIKNLSEDAKGATIYVTLEPCCHHGKQPPCTEAIVEAGIKKVIIGSLDPNPLVSGKGFDYLENNGVEVYGCLLNEECIAMNEVFFHYITQKKPLVIMKCAETLDGKIATHKGLSQWITSKESRKKVHMDRHRYSAVMVGVGTVIADNPMLNCRLCDFVDNNDITDVTDVSQPARIVCDTNLRTPIDSKLVKTAKDIPVIIGTCCEDEDRIRMYSDLGCRIIRVSKENGRVNLPRLIEEIGHMGIDSIILEGGGTLNWEALQSGIVDKIQMYIAPKLFGGADAKSPVLGKGVDTPDDAYVIEDKRVSLIGDDILVEGRLVRR